MRIRWVALLVVALIIGVTSPVSASVEKYPVPVDGATGKRVIYSLSQQHVWLLDNNNLLVRHFRVTGRADWPKPGTYKVFSKSPVTISWDKRFQMKWMTRFVDSVHSNIGFHSIPTWLTTGAPIMSESDLGKPLGIGGCVRLRYYAAKFMYTWTRIGTPVIVLK